MSSTSNTNKNYYGPKRRRKVKDSKIARVARKVAQQEIAKNEQDEVERKFHDKEIPSGTTAGTAGFVTHLSAIGNGTGYNERVGQLVKVMSLQFRMILTAADSSNAMRTIIFRWFDNTAPVVADVLQALPVGATTHPLSNISIDNRHKIQIMYDNMFALDADDPIQVDKAFIKRNMNVNWEVDDTVSMGHIYFLAVSDSTTVSHPGIHAMFRLRYTDQ